MGGRERFEAGDGIRGLAALAVAACHALAFTLVFVNGESARLRPGDDGRPVVEDLPRALVELVALLGHAIWVFFALSGFLLARPFVAAYLADRRRPGLRRYARNRVLRIVPAFWAAVALTAVVRGTGDDGAREVVATLLFAQLWFPGDLAHGIPHAYTLDVEAGFYVALPLAALGLFALPRPRRERARRGVLLALVALAALLSAAVIGHVARTGASWRGTPPGVLALWGIGFAPGMLLAVLEPAARRRLAGRPRTGRRAALGCLVLAVLAAVAAARNPPQQPVDERALLAVLGGALVAAPLVREWAGAGAWLTSRPASWLGTRSYSVYLAHLLVLLPLIDALDAADVDPAPSALVAIGAGLPLVLLAGHLLHVAVEAPFLRLRERASGDVIPSPRPLAAGAAPPAASSSASPR